MKCKGNSAANVSRNTPLESGDGAASPYFFQDVSKCITLLALDIRCSCGIISRTIGKPIRGDRGARKSDSKQAKIRASPKRAR